MSLGGNNVKCKGQEAGLYPHTERTSLDEPSGGKSSAQKQR